MTEGKITTVYAGVEIEYSECADSWECFLGSKSFSKESLSELKKRIDKWVEDEKNFQRFDVFLNERPHDPLPRFVRATVTSVEEDGGVWLSHETGRTKLDARCARKSLFDIAQVNADIIDEIERVRIKIFGLHADIAQKLKIMIPAEIPQGGAQ